MEQYFDKDGNDITEKVKKAQADALTAALKPINDKIAEKDTEITKLKEKDTNFETLKTGYETKITDVEKKLSDFQTSTLADRRNDALQRYSGGNKEVKEKIEAELKALNLPMTDSETIETAIKKAALIVAPEVKPLSVAGARMGGRGSGADTSAETSIETTEQRAFRLKMGVSDEAATKYGNTNDPVKPLIIDAPKKV